VQAIAVAHGAALGITARPDGGLAAELSFPPVPQSWRHDDTQPRGHALVQPLALKV
jgi:hypothetical protein